MQPLRTVLTAFAERPDVAAAVVVSDDGLAVESSLPSGLDADELAALASSAGRAIETLASAAKVGELSQAVIDCGLGTLVLQRLPSRATLLVLAAPDGDLGTLLYDLRRHAPALVSLL
jgi:predicted regulator of Ras-like GTPase activity (Roadblock/LC7/MglB family)